MASQQLRKASCLDGVEEISCQFADVIHVYKVFKESTIVLQSPPNLDKSNCYFFCVKPADSQKRSDDVRGWEPGWNRTAHYLEDSYKLIYKRDEGYCFRKTTMHDNTVWFEKIDPQPQEKDVFSLKKCVVRNSSGSFTKIIYTLISGRNPGFSEKILYQYIGTQPVNNTNTQPVNNTNSEITKCVTVTVGGHGGGGGQDGAGAVNECTNKVGDGFVRSVLNIPDNLPPIICYTDEQISDFKTNCRRGNIIVGIDSTFNLGAYFLTILAYKNTRLVRKESGDHPVVFGPILLHETVTFENYHYFFSHVAAILESDSNSKIDVSGITFGCEHETNVIKAVKSVFKNSLFFLCTKNLEENLTNYLSENCKMDETNVLKYKTLLFGNDNDSLISSRSKLEFDLKHKYLLSEIEKLNLGSQYISEMADQIFNHVCLPRWKLGLKNNWTNHNAESMNYIVSSSVNWQVSGTAQLIDALRETVERHYLNVKKGLYGQGDYILSDFQTKQTTWHNFRDEKKQEIFKHYLNPLDDVITAAEKPEEKRRIKVVFLKTSKIQKTKLNLSYLSRSVKTLKK